jgi:hypothetical protein
MVGRIISDPIFQMGIFGVLVGTIAGLLALRSQARSHPVAVTWGMRLVLVLGVLSLLLLTGWAGWDTFARQGSGHPVSLVSSPVPSASPSVEPTATPTTVPSPTPTPHLSRSITQVLTAFCQALTARDYQTAWNMDAKSLQRRHSYTAVVTAWSHYSQCSIPEQSYDPDAIALLTLTLAPGIKDQYGYTGDTLERFTTGIEAHAWKITQVCHVVSEGCFALVWG